VKRVDTSAALALIERSEARVLRDSEIGELYDFNKNILGYDKMRPEPHGEMCDLLEQAVGDCQFAGNTQTRIMMAYPRNTFKTTVSAEGLPLYVLTKNHNARIMIGSFRHDVAQARVGKNRWHIERNEAFRTRYGDWKPQFREAKWNDDGFVIIPRTAGHREPSLDSSGVDRSKTGSHYDLIILDDVVTDTNIITPSSREKVFSYITDCLALLNPGGVIIVIFTRWHFADAYAKIIKADEQLVRKGLAPMWKKIIRGAWNPDGSLLFPEYLTEKFLEEQRTMMGEKKFSCQYLNEPVEESSKIFSSSVVGPATKPFQYNTDPVSGMGRIALPDGSWYPVNVVLTWDPAGPNPTQGSDYHGLAVVAVDPHDHWYVLEAEGVKGLPTQVLQEVARLVQFYKPHSLSCEDISQSGVWIELARSYFREIGLAAFFSSYKPGNQNSKLSRIEALQPRFEQRRITIDPRLVGLLEQLSEFPELDHDDILDALAQARDFAFAPSTQSIKLREQKDQKPWEPPLQSPGFEVRVHKTSRSSTPMPTGRSPWH
jgi:phage terminase large subunit-like protein